MKAVFSFEKCLNHQNHSSSFLNRLKKPPPNEISDSATYWGKGKNVPPTPPLTAVWKTLCKASLRIFI